MAHIVLFHSVLGLRSAEHLAAERLRSAGHEVTTPDLFAGETASTIDAGFQLLDQIGWSTLLDRARKSLADLPADTVLSGLSMGTQVAADLWPERPETAAVVLLHAAPELPTPVRRGIKVQLHAADPDEFAPQERVESLQQEAEKHGVNLEVFRYSGAGHFYTDPELPDHDPAAAEQTWQRVLAFLG
ncbi:dienelactone hydrolase family protein [Saccharopolyspora antimicrobica]|uniref:dienelactone hydrolase family protein n=1 Tax=Saccharopolyspora antimicrobica TaxID=455193 RepID=UPI000B84400B|nr:dienelactone hydrolase family protein [Saccharopolyspora antimicrobica]